MTNEWRLERDIVVVRGKTWTASFRYLSRCSAGRKPSPIDLSAYTAAMTIRDNVEDSATQITLTTSGGGITLGADGTIEILMTATQTRDNLTVGTGVYEITLTTGTTIIAFAHGNATIYEGVIR